MNFGGLEQVHWHSKSVVGIHGWNEFGLVKLSRATLDGLSLQLAVNTPRSSRHLHVTHLITYNTGGLSNIIYNPLRIPR